MNLPIPATRKRHAPLRLPARAPLAVLLAASLAACVGSGPMTSGGGKDYLLASGR